MLWHHCALISSKIWHGSFVCSTLCVGCHEGLCLWNVLALWTNHVLFHYMVWHFVNAFSILLTYSMEQSPSWEANWSSVSQEIPAFYGTRRFITAFTSARHLSQSLSQISTVSALTSHFLQDPSWYCPPIYAWFIQVVSFCQVSPPKPCIHHSTPPVRAASRSHACCHSVQNFLSSSLLSKYTD